MKKSSQYQTGDIFLVKFHPGYGNEIKRFRPAVIISHKINDLDSRFVSIVPLTTSNKIIHPDYELVIDNPSLDQPSVLLTWYIRTIDLKRLEAKIGQLNLADIKKMQKILQNLFS